MAGSLTCSELATKLAAVEAENVELRIEVEEAHHNRLKVWEIIWGQVHTIQELRKALEHWRETGI